MSREHLALLMKLWIRFVQISLIQLPRQRRAVANSFVLFYPPEVRRSNVADELLPKTAAFAHTDLFDLTFQRKEGHILRRLKCKRSVKLFASCVKKHIFLAFFPGCSAPCFANGLKPFLPRVDCISKNLCYSEKTKKNSARRVNLRPPLNSQVHEWRRKLPYSYKKISRRSWKSWLFTISADLALVTSTNFVLKESSLTV